MTTPGVTHRGAGVARPDGRPAQPSQEDQSARRAESRARPEPRPSAPPIGYPTWDSWLDRQAHPASLNPAACPICTRRFLAERLAEHLDRSQTGPAPTAAVRAPPTIICPACGLKVKPGDLPQHYARAHPGRKVPVQATPAHAPAGSENRPAQKAKPPMSTAGRELSGGSGGAPEQRTADSSWVICEGCKARVRSDFTASHQRICRAR